jgi:CRP-like cAMP-binding protein
MLSLLRECKLFGGCTEQELERVASACKTNTVRAGETIFEAGTPAEHLYVVSEGSVELRFSVTHYDASEEIAIDRKFKGDVFGWSASAEDRTFTLSAVAARNSKLLRISRSDIKRLCAESDHFGHVFMRNIADIIGQRFIVVQRMLLEEIQHYLKNQEPGG